MSTFRLTSDKIDSHLHDVDINMNLALEMCVHADLSCYRLGAVRKNNLVVTINEF